MRCQRPWLVFFGFLNPDPSHARVASLWEGERAPDGFWWVTHLEVTALEDAVGVDDHEAYLPVEDVRLVDLRRVSYLSHAPHGVSMAVTHIDMHPFLLLQSLELAHEALMGHIGGRVRLADDGNQVEKWLTRRQGAGRRMSRHLLRSVLGVGRVWPNIGLDR